MLTVYGIRACDSCRRALKWLRDSGIEHRFHDLRADGLDRQRLRAWLDSPWADALINRRSTTWRGLSASERAASGAALLDLVLAHPTLIKRPVFEAGGLLGVGFDDAVRAAILAGVSGD